MAAAAPKGARARPDESTVREHLRRRRRSVRDGETHVVSWNGRPIRSVKSAMEAASRRAGLKGDATAHVLKHTAITWAISEGMDVEDAADWFDTTATTLESVHRAHSPEHQESARAIMGFRVETGRRGKPKGS
jgi:integrase